jgi:hypothetical protein
MRALISYFMNGLQHWPSRVLVLPTIRQTTMHQLANDSPKLPPSSWPKHWLLATWRCPTQPSAHAAASYLRRRFRSAAPLHDTDRRAFTKEAASGVSGVPLVCGTALGQMEGHNFQGDPHQISSRKIPTSLKTAKSVPKSSDERSESCRLGSNTRLSKRSVTQKAAEHWPLTPLSAS